MNETTALNPVLNPPSHKPLSHLADPEMLTYIDNITRYLHDLSVNANTKEQSDAMTNIRLRMEWLQARLGIMEELLNTQTMNGVELRQYLKDIVKTYPPIKLRGTPAPNMFIIERPGSRPYYRRFINFDWIEWYLATTHNSTPADAYECAKESLRAELVKINGDKDKTLNIFIVDVNTRHPEIVAERTTTTRL